MRRAVDRRLASKSHKPNAPPSMRIVVPIATHERQEQVTPLGKPAGDERTHGYRSSEQAKDRDAQQEDDDVVLPRPGQRGSEDRRVYADVVAAVGQRHQSDSDGDTEGRCCGRRGAGDEHGHGEEQGGEGEQPRSSDVSRGVMRALSRSGRQTFKRFEWAQPGALLHIDAWEAPKFDAPSHRVTGDRAATGRSTGLGQTVVIAVQDDPLPPGLRRAA